jgi:hypothetical protein
MTEIEQDAASSPPPAQPVTPLTPAAVAEMLRKDYREPQALPGPEHKLEIGGVSARIVELPHLPPVLLIRGTDSREDWLLWNVLFRPQMQIGAGETRRWSRGFLRYAERCYGFAKGWLEAGKEIGLIAGHSLGGAAAQIIGPSLKIRTLTFGSPRPLYDKRQPVDAELVTNHVLADDWVCKVPLFWIWPPARFRFVGRVVRHEASEFASASWRFSDKHMIERYKAAATAALWKMNGEEPPV